MTRTSVLTLVAHFFLASVCSATDWPHWAGPNGDFEIQATNAFRTGQTVDIEVVWRKPLGTGYSAVSIRDSLAVTAFSDGTTDYVIALDSRTGDECWRHALGPSYLGHYGSQSGALSTPLLTEHSVVVLGPRGNLIALHTQTGDPLWAVDVVDKHGAIAPFWGFTTSPARDGDRIFVQTGGTNNNAIAAFDLRTGHHLWSALSDSVGYQSPLVDRSAGQPTVIFHGNRILAGLDPVTGTPRWSYEHGGQSGASSTSGHPVRTGNGRYYLKNGPGGVTLAARQTEGGTQIVEEVWRDRNIRGTYIYPIYHAGLVIGFNRRILTAVGSETRDRVWRSRDPGDGRPLILDGHLVVLTKEGRLSVAPLNDEGYVETTGLQLFDDIVWTPPSFAHGRLYARSMGEIACVRFVPHPPSAQEAATAGVLP